MKFLNNSKLLIVLIIMQSLFLFGCKKDKEVLNTNNAIESHKETPDQEKLPFSDKVITGKLDNGLTYYIRKNDFPSDKIELRLNVRSGSLDETDNERGLAHFVEHMAFNGTKNFSGNEVIKFMEKAGLTFGRDSNAETSTNYTNYQLTIPYDNDELIKQGFLILRDWAENITFDEKEIEKEKGVIIEEWRARNDASQRIAKESRKYAAEGSLYPARDPIGLIEVIQGANKDLLKGYYDKWYVSENMSVIVVGNIDEEKAKKLIEENFNSLPKKSTQAHADKGLNYPKGLRVAVVTDKEAKGVSASFYFYNKGKITETYSEFKSELLKRGALAMFSRRALLDINEKKLDLLSLSGRLYLYGNNAEVVSISSQIVPDKFKESIKSILLEIERGKRNGFTVYDLDFFRTSQLSFLETAAKPDYKFASDKYARQIGSYDTLGGSFTEFSQDKELYERVFKESNITSFNNAFKSLFDTSDILFIVTLPERDKDKIKITKEEIEKLMQEASSSAIAKESDEGFTGRLIEEDIKAGTIKEKKEIKNIGAVEVTYSNGAKLIIYKNTEEKDKYLILGKKQGGLSILSNEDAVLSSLMLQSMQKSGFEKISKRHLDNLLASKQAYINPSVTEYTFDFSGGGVSEDLEYTMQLLYKYMTAPVIDSHVLTALKNSVAVKIDADSKDKYVQFGRSANKVMFNDNYRRNYLEKSDLDKATSERLLKIYKDNYLDINNYTFVISGDIDIEKAVSLGAKYIGSLKSEDKKAEYKDRNVYLREKKNQYKGYGDAIDRTTLSIIYMKKLNKDDPLGRYKAAVARNALSIRMREAIREELSGAYSVSTIIKYSDIPRNEVTARISFPCEPARESEVLKGVDDVFNNFVSKGISKDELKSSILAVKNNYKSAVKENKYWVGTIAFSQVMGDKLLSIDEINNIFDNITTDDVNKFIKETLTDLDCFTSIYEPEKK